MPPREVRGLPYRAFVPNAITVMALCFGLTGIRFGFAGEWPKAMLSIVWHEHPTSEHEIGVRQSRLGGHGGEVA